MGPKSKFVCKPYPKKDIEVEKISYTIQVSRNSTDDLTFIEIIPIVFKSINYIQSIIIITYNFM